LSKNNKGMVIRFLIGIIGGAIAVSVYFLAK
jgi:hypothetical protein